MFLTSVSMSVFNYPDGLNRVFTDIVGKLAPKQPGLVEPGVGTYVPLGVRGNLAAVRQVNGALKRAVAASLPLSARPLGDRNLHDNIASGGIVRSKWPHGWVVRAEIQRNGDLGVGRIQRLVGLSVSEPGQRKDSGCWLRGLVPWELTCLKE
jgi:hypothetical protein